MLKDPVLASTIDVPLKAKLCRIDPLVKTFRCKVHTPPGSQFEIRAEADRRIEAALDENGIAFADNTPLDPSGGFLSGCARLAGRFRTLSPPCRAFLTPISVISGSTRELAPKSSMEPRGSLAAPHYRS
jgi:hypothetical protein